MKTRDVMEFMSDQDDKLAAYEAEVRDARPALLRKSLTEEIEAALEAQRRGDSEAVRSHQAHVKYLRNELKKYKH